MILSRFSERVNKSLTPAAITQLMKSIANYIDYNSEIIMTLDLSRRYSFGDANRAVVYEAIGVTEAELEEAIRDSKYINNSNKIHRNPFYTACMLTMNCLIKKKKETEAINIMLYMSLMMYTSVHKGFFKYNVNKQVIDYTLAHLDNSFRIVSMNSIYEFLMDNAKVTYDTYKKRIERCDDSDITYVVDALHTRIKGKMRKIANAVYDNHKSGRYLNMDSDSITEDDYHEVDNNAFAVERLAGKIYIRLLNHQFDDRLIKYSITRSDVSYQKLKNLIDDIIQDDESNIIKSYLINEIDYFISASDKGYEGIARGDFITYMKAAYASNTELPQMAKMKSILDNWLTEHAVTVGRANYGKTARMSYKKALYMFFVFVTNYEAKT